MPHSLVDLQSRRSQLLADLAQLDAFRPGSVTGIVRRCGKPTCHCAQQDDPGHGPTIRFTYKLDGKTISESLPTPAAVRKAEREIAEFRKFQILVGKLVEVNRCICQMLPAEVPVAPPQEKKRRRQSSAKLYAKSAS